MLTSSAVTAIALALSMAAGPGADEHVLAGARFFRENRFAEALVEFRVAERLGAEDAPGYAAAALVKLERPEEALDVFERSSPVPRAGDPLLEYYHALACYDARLYVCADEILARIGKRTGPRIAEQATKIRADIAKLLSTEPSRESIDWYIARSDEHARQSRQVLARAFAREARALAARRSDAYGAAPATERLERLAQHGAAAVR